MDFSSLKDVGKITEEEYTSTFDEFKQSQFFSLANNARNNNIVIDDSIKRALQGYTETKINNNTTIVVSIFTLYQENDIPLILTPYIEKQQSIFDSIMEEQKYVTIAICEIIEL